MIRDKLLELKNDIIKTAQEASAPVDQRDIRLVQDVKARIGSDAKVLVIQNQQVNVTITNNLICLIQKIDEIVQEIDATDLVHGALGNMFLKMHEAGIGVRELGGDIALCYLDWLEVRYGSLAEVSRQTGDKRTTLVEFRQRIKRERCQKLET